MEKTERALVVTKNEIIYRLVALELSPDIECDMADEVRYGYDYIIYDYDDTEYSSPVGIGIGFSSGADITLPFPIGKLRERLLTGHERIAVDIPTLSASIGERIIKLTELEATLLDLIIKGGKEYTSREVLHHALWGDRATDGALNVYIHYLRRKLELGAERIILSSRQGYKINERYL